MHSAKKFNYVYKYKVVNSDTKNLDKEKLGFSLDVNSNFPCFVTRCKIIDSVK